LVARFPVHVTVRMEKSVRHLRNGRCFRAVARAVRGAQGRFGTGVVHFSVQGNHIHLIVESTGERALMAAMKGLSVRLAKALNRASGRRGRVIADRYHAHYLRTLAEARNAVAYVLANHTHHFARRGVDEYASAAHPDLVVGPRTWLLAHAPRDG
jgi:REP element-mobilizing transposase RayT